VEQHKVADDTHYQTLVSQALVVIHWVLRLESDEFGEFWRIVLNGEI